MQPELTDLPEVRELTTTANYLAVYAQGFRVATAEQYSVAGIDLTRIKAASKRLNEIRTGITRPMDAAKKAVIDFFRAPEDKLTQAERLIKTAMNTFDDEQNRLRREEQRKADEAARKERERLEAIARDTERKAREKADAERKAADEAAAAGRAEEATRLREKAQATEQKAAEKAAAFDERAATAVAPIISREPPKVAGISKREVWKFEIMDETKIPRQYLVVDQTKIRSVVNAMKGDSDIPGVRVWAEQQIAASVT